MATYVKSEVVWLPCQEEVVVKQEKDDSQEDLTNTCEYSCQKLIECKAEEIHEISIKEELQEPIKAEELCSLDLQHINHPKTQHADTPVESEIYENGNDDDLEKDVELIPTYPYCKTDYFMNKEDIECYDKKQNNFLNELSSEKSPTEHEQKKIGEKCFACDLCNKTFNSKHHLARHVKIHTGEKPFSCDLCNQKFSRKELLISHRRIHTGEKPFLCDLCTEKFTQKSHLIRHRRTHTGEKPYSCDTCHKKFAEKDALNKHGLTHSGEKPFSCDLCNERFSLKSILTTHMLIHTGQKSFSCDVCDKKFRHKGALTRHKKTHLKVKFVRIPAIKSEACENVNYDDLEKDTELIPTHPYCKTEYFINNYEEDMECYDERHKNSQNELSKESSIGHEKCFSCDLCDKAFKTKHHLSRHVRTHTGEKPFSCDQCNHKFTRKELLISHKRIHTGEKPFSCDICTAKFTQRPHMVRHRRTHTGEKPFSCDTCHKKFTARKTLNKHVLTHNDEKIFSCHV